MVLFEIKPAVVSPTLCASPSVAHMLYTPVVTLLPSSYNHDVIPSFNADTYTQMMGFPIFCQHFLIHVLRTGSLPF